MKKLILLIFLYANNSIAIDLTKMRVCVVNHTTTAADLYHPSKIKKGYFVRLDNGSYKVSLNDILDDHFLYFTKDKDSLINMNAEYVWRYSGRPSIKIDGRGYTVYDSYGPRGPILIIFNKRNANSVSVRYLNLNDGRSLLSLSCDPYP